MAQAAAAADVPAADPQQGLADVLANQERIRKSTDLPLFYAQKEKDTCTAELFIQRFEVAAQIARWIGAEGAADRYDRTCREFYLLLRGNALQWWASLDNCLDFDKTNWPLVKERFLESYARQYTPTSACTGLTEMKQRPGESVQDYFVRCNVIYDRIKEIKPVELDAWRGAVPAGQHANCLNRGKMQGVKEMGLFFLHLLFVVGLREDIRMKTIEAGDNNLEQARLTAKQKELLLNDKKQVGKVFGVKTKNESESEDDEYGSEVEEVLGNINALRRQQGKKPFRIGKKFNFKNIQCHYCKKKGHFQKICRKRQKDGAPMVNNKRVNEIINVDETESEEDEPTAEDEEVNSITSSMTLEDYYGVRSLKATSKNLKN